MATAYDKKREARDGSDSRKLPRSRVSESSVLLTAMIAELNSARFGLVQGQAEVTSAYSSYSESKSHILSGRDNGYILRMPFAGTTVKFEMFFNLNDPLLTPDFVCLSDEEFCPDIEASLPSLARWGEQRHTVPLAQQIVYVTQELLEAFRRYQLSKLKYQYPTLRSDCVGDTPGEDVEICLEMVPPAPSFSTATRSPDPPPMPAKPTWCLHALCKLPSLPSKTHQFLSNPQDAKGPIYFYWGLTLPASSNGTGPCSTRPSSARPEVVLLRNDSIKDFFNEFGFKTPSIDANEPFAVTSTRYIEAFNSFLAKTPQSLERRRQILEAFGDRLQIVHLDCRRWAFASYLVRTTAPSQGNCALLNVSFISLMSNALPVVELVSAYPVPRFPGATRKTFLVKLPNVANSLDQVKPNEFVEKTETLLGHVAPLFISELLL